MTMQGIDEASELCRRIVDQVGETFVGDRTIIRKMLAAALANGHVLFEDYPGLGKTLLAKTFARVIGCETKRVQFTPDLLPADIVGTQVWRQRTGEFELVPGPIFTNVLLADEINRTPPKTQAALLEAMEERQVTIEGETLVLDPPFVVLGTQNPIEQEGTYPLPEAQLDRFLLRLSTGYPATVELEGTILSRRIEWRKDDPTADLGPAVDRDTFVELQQMVESAVYVDPAIITYISQLVRATRAHRSIAIGSSPRGSLALLKIARSLALIHGRDYVVPDDVKMVVGDALAHRVILVIEETLEGVTAQDVISDVIQSVPVPTELMRRPGR